VFGNCHVTLENCSIHGSEDNGVQVMGGAHVRLEECEIYKNSSHGVHVTAGHVRLLDCDIHGNERHGVCAVGPASTVTLDKGKIHHHNNARGIHVEGGAKVTAVVRCSIHSNQEGVHLTEKGTTGDFTDCEIEYNNIGIDVSKGGILWVNHCTIRHNRTDGLDISGCETRVHIRGGKIHGHIGSGIRAQGAATVTVAEVEDESPSWLKTNDRRCFIHDNGIGLMTDRDTEIRIGDPDDEDDDDDDCLVMHHNGADEGEAGVGGETGRKGVKRARESM